MPRIVAAKLHDLHFDVFPYAPYSPDLAPSDYFLFPNMKKWFAGRKFTSDDEVKSATMAYFPEQDKTYYSDGIIKLESRWYKCIELQGDYVEK